MFNSSFNNTLFFNALNFTFFESTSNITSNITMFDSPCNLTNITSHRTYPNASQQTASPCSAKTSSGNIVYTIFLCLVLIFGLFGNTLVCLTVILCRQLRKQITNYFIFSLAVSDIAVSTISLPFRIYTSLHNQAFCAGLGFCMFFVLFDSTSSAASITNLFIIALDRHFIITMPYRYPSLLTRKRAVFICICIWVYSHLWSWSSAYTWTRDPKLSISVVGNLCTNTNREFVFTSIVLLYLIPLIIMGIVYANILRIASKQAKSIAMQEVTLKGQKRRARERKATTTLAIIYGAFVICWLPNFILALAVTSCPLCFKYLQQHAYWLFMALLIIFVQVLPVLNSAMNPFIYGIHNKQFRDAFRQLVFRRKASKMYDSDNGNTRMSEFRRTTTSRSRGQRSFQNGDNQLLTNESTL